MQGAVRVFSAAACALSLSIACASSAQADVVPVVSASGSGTGSTVTASIAVPAAGTGKLLAVGISTTNTATVTGVAYAGQALTKRVSQGQSGTGVTGVAAEIWTLSAPPSGNGTVTVTLSAAAPAIVGATAYTGVDAIDPVIVATATPGDDSSNAASIALNNTTAGDGMFGVLALGNVSNTSTPFTQGSTDLVQADLRWATLTGTVRGAGATRIGNTGQNQATTAGINWRWTNVQSQLNPHVDAVAALRKAGASIAPAVTTADATDVTTTSAKLGGQVTNNGNGILTARGVAYCLSPCTPTLGAPGTSIEQDANNSLDPFTFTAASLTGAKGYTVRAFATNSAGTGYGASKTFTTATPNRAPVAVAIPAPANRYTITEGDGLALDASQSSDPDGDVLTYAWDLDGDTEYDDATGATPTLTAVQADALGFGDGPFNTILGLRVSDGKTTTAGTVPLTVLNATPTATPSGDTTVPEGSPATIGLDNAADAGPNDRSTLRYFFDTDGDGVANGSGETYGDALNDASTTFTPDDNATLHLTAAVIDKDEAVSRYARDLVVTNVAPTATFANDGAVDEGEDAHVAFTAPSDPSAADTGAGFRYAYDTDNDGTWDVGDGTYAGGVIATSLDVPTDDDGTVTVRGAIVDKDDGVATYTTAITVGNVAPAVTLATPAAVQEGTPLTLTADVADASGADAAAGFTYTIAWGDGKSDTVAGPPHTTATHIYAAAGTYSISVTATDKDGAASAAATTTATVTAAPAPPTTDTTPTTPAPAPTPAAPVAAASTPKPTPVSVSGLSVAPRCVKASAATTRSVKLKYKLSGAATVRVTLQRATGSTLVRSCPPLRGVQQDDGKYKPGKYTPVSTQQTTGTSLTIASGSKNSAIGTIASLRPQALLAKGTKLKAGTYLITVTPLGADNKPNGAVARVKFWVLKG
ncbi:PKD domain-containing protein [Baekduia sp. Peel2402]|uniref:PKD domain-containing protein n=1 Tax=Baekduia sp. Peel2402 TaxID=3458296 RepID=UPI00403EAC19